MSATMVPKEASENGFRMVQGRPPVFQREKGYVTAVVQHYCGVWGWTLWDRNECVVGGKNWNWDMSEAVLRAAEAQDEHVAAKAAMEAHAAHEALVDPSEGKAAGA